MKATEKQLEFAKKLINEKSNTMIQIRLLFDKMLDKPASEINAEGDLVSQSGYFLDGINISFKDRPLNSVYLNHFEGTPFGIKAAILVIERFGCLKTADTALAWIAYRDLITDPESLILMGLRHEYDIYLNSEIANISHEQAEGELSKRQLKIFKQIKFSGLRYLKDFMTYFSVPEDGYARD